MSATPLRNKTKSEKGPLSRNENPLKPLFTAQAAAKSSPASNIMAIVIFNLKGSIPLAAEKALEAVSEYV